MKIKKGDKVTIKGTETRATVLRVSREGICQVRLESPTQTTLRIHSSSLSICNSNPDNENGHADNSNIHVTIPPQEPPTEPSTEKPTEKTVEMQPQQRSESGRFLPGGTHPYYPVNREKVATARSLRQSLTQGMADLVDSLPRIIGAIDEPEKKASAINATLRIILPQYSSIKFSDAPPRQLNAEQQLAKMKEEFLKSQKG